MINKPRSDQRARPVFTIITNNVVILMAQVNKRQELINVMVERGYTPVSIDVNKNNHKIYVVFWKRGDEAEIGFPSYQKAIQYFQS